MQKWGWNMQGNKLRSTTLASESECDCLILRATSQAGCHTMKRSELTYIIQENKTQSRKFYVYDDQRLI